MHDSETRASCLQVVFFMYYVPVFGLLLDTLKQAQSTLLGFMVVFLVVFYGFAQSHAMIFGEANASFRTIEMSSYTLLRSLLGDFDFEALHTKDAYMGPLFFVLYIMLAVSGGLPVCSRHLFFYTRPSFARCL